MSDLKAVRVPPELEPLFQRAESFVRDYFAAHHSDPSKGLVEFHGERYIHVRAASISIEFFDLVRRTYQGHRDADEVARGLLFDVAHALGMADARDFQREMGVTDPMEALSTGPVHFAYTGWALVDIESKSNPTPDDDYLLVYTHPNSFEADAWLKDGREPGSAVCVMNAGYSSGWCEASFGLPLLAREVQCRALGHDACRFLMAPPHRMEDQVAAYAREHPDAPLAGPPPPRFFEQLRRRDQELVHAQRMEAIGRLAGGIAHDFNNLLTVILACGEQMLVTLPGDSVERKNAEAIVGAAERAGGLTRQLLALSARQVLDLHAVDLGQLVRDLQPLLEGLMAERVALEWGPLPEAVVEIEPRAVEQVIVNLAVNALEAMPDGGRFALSLAGDGVDWCLTVSDDGPGMSPEVAARVFEPFFTTKVGNSGLGLAAARGILAQFGGSLVVVVTAVGTTLELRLPYSSRELEPPDVAPSGLGRGGLVLVIEDDDAIRDMLARFLPDAGFTVFLASSSADAVEIAHAQPRLDVVLSDIVLAHESGPDAVAAVRQLHPHTPVVYMTGYAERHHQQVPDDAVVLQKPFTIEAVYARLRTALGEPAES